MQSMASRRMAADSTPARLRKANRPPSFSRMPGTEPGPCYPEYGCAVRFFKDAGLQNRVRFLVCDGSEASDGGIRSEGCKLRGACADELRAPNRNGDAGH